MISMRKYRDICQLIGNIGHYFFRMILRLALSRCPDHSRVSNQLVGLREKLQQTPIFHGKMGKSIVSCRFSLQSTHWSKAMTIANLSWPPRRSRALAFANASCRGSGIGSGVAPAERGGVWWNHEKCWHCEHSTFLDTHHDQVISTLHIFPDEVWTLWSLRTA